LPKVIAIHRLTLNDGVDPGAFEQFVRSDVFPGLSVVFQVDKTLSHGLTKIDWLSSEHLLLRPGPQTDSGATYLWMISAPVADAQLSTVEGRRAVEEEALDKAQSFFDLGSIGIGKQFNDEIATALQRASVVLVFFNTPWYAFVN